MLNLQKNEINLYFILLFLIISFSIGCSFGDNTKDSDSSLLNKQTERKPGQTSFISASAGLPNANNKNLDYTLGDASQNSTSNNAEKVSREIEEADIIKTDGDILFLLNSYKGLIIIDMSDDTNPLILGKVSLSGRPVEMYIRGNFAYIIINTFDENHYIYTENIAVNSDEYYYGYGSSSIIVINMEDKKNPSAISTFEFSETISDTRIVGDVLYAIAYLYDYANNQNNSSTSIVSFNLSDPGNISEIDRKKFTGISNEIHVTQGKIFVALTGEDNLNYNTSSIQIADIADPGGKINLAGKISIEGIISDRFKMDFYSNSFRVVSYSFEKQESLLYTIDISNIDSPQILGTLPIIKNERLFATRFDGDRAYIVTYFIKDPLWIIDLSDPANPKKIGELEVPGWATHIEPRGSRLTALGVDDTDGWRVYVALYDISNPANPIQKQRLIFGNDYSWTEAYNDYKSFKIIDELELIALPIQGYDTGNYYYYSGVQLINFDSTSLVKKGFIKQDGAVKRVLNRNGTLYTISNEQLQATDITDRDNPIVKKDLGLAKYIKDFKTHAGYGYKLIDNVYSGSSTLEVVKLGTGDSTEIVLSSTILPIKYAQIIDDFSGPMIVFGYSTGISTTSFILLDISDPKIPVLKTTYIFSKNNYFPFYASGNNSLITGSNVIKTGNTLAVKIAFYNYFSSSSSGDTGSQPHQRNLKEDYYYKNGIMLFDISDISAPKEGKFIEFTQDSYIYSMQKINNMLYLTTAKNSGNDTKNNTLLKFYLNIIDINNAYNPITSNVINIPGIFLARKNDTIFTLDQLWTYSSGNETLKNYIHSLKIENSNAILKNSLFLENNINDIFLFNDNFHLSYSKYSAYSEYSDSDQNVKRIKPIMVENNDNLYGLQIVSISDPENLKIVFTSSMDEYQNILALDKGWLFVLPNWGNSVNVYNLNKNPDSLIIRTSVVFPYYTYTLTVADDIIYSPVGYYGVFTAQIPQ